MRVALLFLCFALAAVTDGCATKPVEAHSCIYILTQIDGAKQQWALEQNKTSSDKPT